MPETKRPRRLRRLMIRVVLATPVLLVALVAAAPWLLSTSVGKNFALGKVNAILAPSRIGLDSWELSWTGSTKLNGLALHDAAGKTLLSARRATLDRSVWQLITKRPDYGTLTLSGAMIDVERKHDGSIDVTDAIAPLMASDPNSKSDPNTAITVKFVDGTLKLRSPELTEPFVAASAKGTLVVPAAPEPLNALVELENSPGETLRVEGRYDHRSASADLSAHLKSAGWPLAIATTRVAGRGTLDSSIHLGREKGRWATSGEATLHGVDATGAMFSGDRVRLTRVVSDWDVAADDSSWSVKKLEVKTHVGSISARRTPKADGKCSSILQGRFDLAALAKEFPHSLRLRPGLVVEKGVADIRAEIVEGPGTQELDIRVSLPGLKAHDGERAIVLEDASTLAAHVIRSADGVQVDRVACRTGFCDLAASGDMENGIHLKGDLDLGVMQDKLGAMIDFGALKLAGRAVVSGSYSKHADIFQGGFKADIVGLSVAGLTAEPIAEQEVRLESNAEGPSDSSGLPAGWSKVSLVVRGTDVALNTSAERSGEQIELRANVAANVTQNGRAGRAEAHLKGRVNPEKVFDFETAQVFLRPIEADSQAAEIVVAAMGRFDTAKGTLSLNPIPGSGPGVIAPAEGGLTIAGLNVSGEMLKVAGGLTGELRRIDRAVAYWRSSAPQGIAGRLIVDIDASRDSAGLVRFDARLDSPDVILPGSTRSEGALGIRSNGNYQTSGNMLDLANLHIQSSFGALDASGSLRDPGGSSVIDARGTLAPNWKLVDALMASSVEPNAVFKAEARPFHVKGPLNGGNLAVILRGLDAELGVNMTSASAFGVNVGPAPVVVRCANGQVTIDPIETTINTGKLYLRPTVAMNDSGDIAILLKDNSAIMNAAIDDEVSTRVLSYVAPMLHEAARASGHLTVGMEHAEIPVVDSSGRTVDLAGNLAFQQVTFGPGPMVRQVLGVMGEQNVPELSLNQAVPFWVSHGKVGQKGLAVVVNPKVQVDFDGSVGFDGSLALRAGVPLNAAMLGNNQLVNEIVDGTRVGLPIGGTLSRPVLDRRALEVALRDAGRTMVKRGVQAEARQLLDRVGGNKPGQPVAPNSPRGLADDALDLLLPSSRRDTAPPR